jgi:hypothetical protein
MNNDNVFELKNPGVTNEVRDVLTEVPRNGAQQLLAQAVLGEFIITPLPACETIRNSVTSKRTDPVARE